MEQKGLLGRESRSLVSFEPQENSDVSSVSHGSFCHFIIDGMDGSVRRVPELTSAWEVELKFLDHCAGPAYLSHRPSAVV